MISAIYANNKYLISINQVSRNMVKISCLAIPIICSCVLNTASAGLASYTACISTCTAMAAMATTLPFAYTFESCMASCSWMLSPACP